ncbi:MAG: Serine/threonine-protein kinase PrkC, partial [Pseudomonadota bacterium]
MYEALHRDLGKRFALKLLHDAVSVGARQRFLLEARAMARILHPNSVAVFDVDVHAEVPFLVMELLEGEDLARHCGRQGPLSVQHTADVLVPVVAAVSAAHAHGIVHRDLKPSNVFLATRASGITPKVLDFGIAKASLAEPSEALTASGVLLGTPHYMSPEQAHGGMPVDVRSDQYSLGVLLYECVTGRQPLQGVGLLALIAQLLQGAFPRPRTLAPQLPLAFEQLILRSMALSPDERFASAAALGAALLPFASAEVQSAYSVELNGLELPPSAARRSALGAGDTAALGAGDTAALGTSAASWPRTVRPPLVSAPLAASIPRRPELARLAELVQSASSGAGRALFVLGEAGIGKSTLIQAALEQARRDAPECLTAIGHCQEQFSIAEPYAPFLDGLGALLAHDPGAQLRATLQLHAPLWCLQFPAHFAEAATLEQLKRATLGATRERMLREFVEAISRLARLQPLIFVLEDLHWADPASIDLLRCLCRRVARERVLLICSLRIDEAEIGNAPLRALRREVLAHDRCEELTLAAFSREHIRSYLDQLLQPNDFSGALAQCLQARTEGHALFMARLVQYLIDRGDIVSTARGWRLTRPAQELDIELPDSVRGLIQRRLELLDDEQRRVLQYASVEGDEFTTAVLARLLELPEESVQERLAPLRDVHRLVQQLGEDSPAPGCHTLRFRFSHVLYQNTLYGELVSARKRRLHREAAEAYLAQYGLRATELAARIARHFELAQELGRAIEHWLMAGDRALRAYAYREAEHFYGHSLTLVAALPEPERPRLSAVGRRKRAWAHFHQGDLGAAARDLEQALDHARELGDA